ncbi:hypothetical protein BDW22DRAFT_1383945 [Trametopsis cervina]|nr:hypothetical protein BDW22DRAFT_1383945 [Trametopsis cervina]
MPFRRPQKPSQDGERVTLRTVVSRTFSHLKFPRKPERRTSPQVPNPRYLPIELWGVVIKHACLAYFDPLDTSHELSFLENESRSLDMYKVSMKDKLACSLVSRQWHAYATDFLYEFIWIRNASQAKSLAHLLLLQSLHNGPSYGSCIRRLHIETPVLELCAPADLRSILENAPGLCIYSDRHSIQRSLYDDARCSPEAILKLIAQPKIRRLSWTCYSDAPLQPRLIPLWTNIAANLEFLELSSCSSNVRTAVLPAVSSSSNTSDMDVCLPSLRALRVSLDDDTFAVLSLWDMPQLTNLCVLSSDFSYTGPGFTSFFRAHGHKLVQLELGHAPSLIEDHYLTSRPRARTPTPNRRASLAEWCPNLREFICAADAEWHWQSPDWLPAHILLSSHPTLELIGIRGIDVRLREDPDLLSGEAYFTLYEQLSSLLQENAFPALKYVRDMSKGSEMMRSQCPPQRVLLFWRRLVERCKDRRVWLEDCGGMNINHRTLLRAARPGSSHTF